MRKRFDLLSVSFFSADIMISEMGVFGYLHIILFGVVVFLTLGFLYREIFE